LFSRIHHLTDEQKKEWKAIVNSMPVDWFSREVWSLLEALVCHTSFLSDVEAKLRDRAVPDDKDEMAVYKTLVMMQVHTSKVIMSLQAKLRLTNQSRYNCCEGATPVGSGSCAGICFG
jgi:hypothetical protein